MARTEGTDGRPAAAGGASLAARSWVVVPSFNEAARLGAVLDGLVALWPNVVVVDDGSADPTPEVVRGRPVWLVRHAVNLGQGAALQTGLRFALERGAAFLVTFDADGQHDPADVAPLLAPLAEGRADFALGSRFLGEAPGIPWARRLLLRCAVLFTRVVHGPKLTDSHNGLRAMTRRGAEALRIDMNRMEHASQLLEQIHRSGLAWVEVPVTVRYTRDSLAKGQRTSSALKMAARLLLEKVLR